MNGQRINVGDPTTVIFKAPDQLSGISSISLKVQNKTNVLQFAEEEIKLKYDSNF
jgi:hypothetical protein